MELDVLVIGGGGAGMRAALEAARTEGISVGLLSKSSPLRSTTGSTGGGINAILPATQSGDSLERYTEDTVVGSGSLADPAAVGFFVEQATEAIVELNNLGVPFYRNPEGLIAQRKGGGSSFPRICLTHGHALAHTLYEKLVGTRVVELTGYCLLELVVAEGRIQGVIAYDMNTGEVVPIAAKAVVIATGGYGRIYWQRTTNPLGCTGDGIAACLHAGIAFKDPEFIQFHPTALAGSGIMISEGARSEGGRLYNRLGERFMSRYAPEAMEMATRDLISFAIEREISEGRGFSKGLEAYVMLDLRHLGDKTIREKLSQVYQTVRKFAGVDPSIELIPIRPGSHFTMGGIDIVDYKTCATVVNGLYAAGECAAVSVHGANRLGGNALTEILVFGKVAGASAAENALRNGAADRDSVKKIADRWKMNKKPATASSSQAIVGIRNQLATIMWNQAGIIRNEEGLARGLRELQQLQEDLAKLLPGPSGQQGGGQFVRGREVANLLTVAQAVVLAAINRRESRGCHCRTDYDSQRAEFARHSLVSKKNGEWLLEYRDLDPFQPANGREPNE